MKVLRLFFTFCMGTASSQQDAADGIFHLGGDTPFYSGNTDSEAIWITNL